MQRFYKKNLENRFFLEQKDFMNQILKVLRSKIGDKFIFFDGEIQKDFIYELKEIGKNKIFFEKIEEINKNSEINFELNLFSALPNKIEKIEFIVQKATEIGVSNFYFWKAKRSQKIFLNENKIERIKKIILEAVEQSGRNKIPNFQILEKVDFEKLTGKNIFFHTKNKNSKNLKDLEFSEKINIFTGPEGGFGGEELEIFEENNFEIFYLGDRILRTETSAISTAFFIIQKF
ncbi:hypothetical protein DLH72_01555 [Candidatus Gracilibacteria bacterium]|nr:MAG: hypothetical protein DLH72_01555 [Candidatus Gracilibacteria bacterium]